MANVKLGDRLVAVVDPRGNAGADEAPATVTRVRPDGTVDATAHLIGGAVLPLEAARVYPSRSAVNKYLTDERENLRPAKGEGDDPYPLHEVLKWVSALYDPTAAKEKPAAVPPAVVAPPVV